MFFVLSKILLFAFSPLVWAMAMLLIALLLKKANKKRNLILLSFFTLYFFSNSFIFDEVIRKWELKPIDIKKDTSNYNYVIVLGGMVSYYDNKHNQIGFNPSIDRLFQGIKAKNIKNIKTLVITSGDGSALQNGFKEADVISNYLKDICLNPDTLIFENKSRNTHENAVFTYNLIKPKKSDKVLIVTSAFHMRRALGCFNKAGFNANYYLADRYAGKRKFTIDHMIVPEIETLKKWSTLIHEISGYIMYKIMGYI